jgi:non-specific serine/threonine protein kinase/serine/threonine-protein kinase
MNRLLQGDLDNIILKALRKEPGRRYASAEQFAEDIRRHLQGLPVTATPDSILYRAKKFAWRYKAGVAAVVLIALAVAGGVLATLREARVAAESQRRAERRFNDVRQLANSLLFEIHDSIRDLPGSTPARRLLVTRALEYLDGLSQQAQGDASLQKELASAYERVGDVLGYPYAANLGDLPGAMQSYRKALAIRESLVASHGDDRNLQIELASNYVKLAHVLEAEGNFQQALSSVRTALPITEKIAAADKSPARADQFAGSYYFMAGLLMQTGDVKGALENYERAAAIRQVGLQSAPQNLPLRSHLAADLAGEAKAFSETKELIRAVQSQGKAIAILEDVSQANPNNAVLREYLGEAVNRIGLYHKSRGNPQAALDAYTRAHQIFRELLAADPNNSLAAANFGFSENGIASSLQAAGKLAQAVNAYQEAAVAFERMAPRTEGSRYPRTGLAETYSGLGLAYRDLALGKETTEAPRRRYWHEARAAFEKSLALWQQKEKLGELESGERQAPQAVARGIAECDAHLRASQRDHNPAQ